MKYKRRQLTFEIFLSYFVLTSLSEESGLFREIWYALVVIVVMWFLIIPAVTR